MPAMTTSQDREAWGRLAHALSHEIRGPLNALGLYVELLTMQREPDANAAFSAKAREQVQRVDQLLGDLLLLWAPSHEGPADLSTIVSVALRLAGRDGRRRGDWISADVTPGLRVRVAPDAAVDLVVGALAAADATGQRASVRLVRTDDGVRLEVLAKGIDAQPPLTGSVGDAGKIETSPGRLVMTFVAI